MITWIGDGGHARVCREIAQMLWLDKRMPDRWFISVGDNGSRKIESLSCPGPYATLIHPGAIVSPSAEIGVGSVIMAGAVIQAGARIGKHCIVNTAATVDHDCVLGDFVHIAPGAHLCGAVNIGSGALVGVGIGIEPGVIIPAWCVVKRERSVCVPLFNH